MTSRIIKKLISTILCVSLVMSLFAGLTVRAADDDGKIHIYTKYDLKNEISSNICGYDKHDYVLENDIIFETKDFEPGGMCYNNGKGWSFDYDEYEYGFRGTFDGNGHTIDGLRFYDFSKENRNDDYYVTRYFCGLFPYAQDSQIKNLNITNAVASFTSSLTDDSYSYGEGYSNTASASVGLLVGMANNTNIYNCSASGSIDIKTNNGYCYCERIGGLVGGLITGSISKCTSAVNIQSEAGRIGGVAGNIVDCSVDHLSYKGKINTNYFYWCGGIVGTCNSNITDCYNTGTIRTSVNDPNDFMVNTRYIGGIAGDCGQIVNRCYNKGNVECKDSKGYGLGKYITHCAAGIVGAGKSVSNCYNKGKVFCVQFAGGIIGQLRESYTTGVECCYNSGKITSTEEAPDGICGIYINKENSSGFNYISKCYSLSSAVEKPRYGRNVATIASAKKMKVKRFYRGFNFNVHWDISESKNEGYPFLRKISSSKISGDEYIKWSSTGNDLEYPIYTETSFAKQLRYWASITDGFTALSPNADLSEYKKLLHITVDVPAYGDKANYLIKGKTEIKDVMAYALFAERAKEYSENTMQEVKSRIIYDSKGAYQYFLDRICNFNTQLFYFEESLNGKSAYGEGLISLLLASTLQCATDKFLEDETKLTYKFATNLTKADVAESNKYFDNITYYLMSGGDKSYLNDGYSDAVDVFNNLVKFSKLSLKIKKTGADSNIDQNELVDLNDIFLKNIYGNFLDDASKHSSEIKELKEIWDYTDDVSSLVKAVCSYNLCGIATSSFTLSNTYINKVKGIYEDVEKSEAGWYALSYYYLSKHNETLLKSLFDPSTGSASFGIDRIAEYGLPYDESDSIESAIMGRWSNSSYLDHTYTPKQSFRMYLYNASNTMLMTEKKDLYDNIDSLMGYITAKKNLDEGIYGIDVSIKASSNNIDLGSVTTPKTGNTANETTVKANPKNNVRFIGWKDTFSEEYVSHDTTYTFIPNGNVELEAVFIEGDVPSAAKPVITTQPKDIAVYQGEQKTLSLKATTSDVGELSVSWYKNTKYSNIGGEKVGKGFSFEIDTTNEGSYYYYAIVENKISQLVGSKTVTTTSSVRSAIAKVNIRKPIIKSIKIGQMPEKTVYQVNDSFDKAGLMVYAEYSDGTVKGLSKYDVSYDFSSVGAKTVTVTAANKTATLNVTVDTPVSVKIVSPPSKTTYMVGEKLNKNGLKVVLSYKSGTQQEINNYKTEYSFNSTGTKTVTIKVKDLSASFEINVVNRENRVIYFKNSCDWDTPYAYCWNDSNTPTAWPGNKMDYVGRDKNGKDVYSITVSNNCNNIIFNNGNSSGQTEDINLDNYKNIDGFDVSTSSDSYAFTTFVYNSSDMNYIEDNPETTESKLHFINKAGWSNVYCYMWNKSVNNSQNQNWPGKILTDYETDQNGNKIFSCDFDSSKYDGVIFNNGSGTQTDDLTPQKNQYYDYVSKKWYLSTQDFSNENYPHDETVYLINSQKWSSAHCYMFNYENQSLTNGTWPGKEMKLKSTEDNGVTIYSYTYSSIYNRCIFSRNGTSQTSDLITHPGMYYDNTNQQWYSSLDEYFDKPSGDSTAVSTAYFICPADWDAPYAYFWDSDDISDNNKSWPGESMVKVKTLSDGTGVYYCKYNPSIFDCVVFNNNGNAQTKNLSVHSEMYYDLSTDNWYKSVEDYENSVPTNKKKIYFINSQRWNNPYCYLISDNNEQNWKLSALKYEGVTDNDSYYYSCIVDCVKYPRIAFTDGTATIDILTPMNDKYYDNYSEKWYSSIESYTNNTPNPTKTVYVINSESWSSVNCYLWNSANKNCVTNSWPGVSMQKVSTTENGYNVFSADYNSVAYDSIIFNNNNQQTDDLTIEDESYYDLTQNKWFDSLEEYYDSFKNHYYLCGYIENEDYGIGTDSKNIGDYEFKNGKLKIRFDTDSYVAVKDQNNKCYMTNGFYGTDTNGAILKDKNDLGNNANKLFVPKNKTITFNLMENNDGSLTLSYSYDGMNPSGDFNYDGKVNILDVTLIQKSVLGLVEFSNDQKKTVDYNHDNKLTIRDATLLQMKLVGINVENGTVEVNHYILNNNDSSPELYKTETLKGKHNESYEIKTIDSPLYQLDTEKSSEIRTGTFSVMNSIKVDLYYTDVSENVKLHLKNESAQESLSPYLYIWANDSKKSNLNHTWPGDIVDSYEIDGWYEYDFSRIKGVEYNLIISNNGINQTKNNNGFTDNELWIVYKLNGSTIELTCYTDNPETNPNAPKAIYTVE